MVQPPVNDLDVKYSKQRRSLLKTTLGISALGIGSGLSLFTPGISYAAALTREERDKLTPDQIIARMKEGNLRFRTGKMQQHDYLAQKRASAGGQFPTAIILGCIDSRAPAEILFDTQIGETFNTRIAGNVANNDLLGSMEYACAVAGAKVILVLGHTACGAVRGAIDGVELGHLTGLLDKIKPAIDATEFNGERTGKNYEFVDAVAKTNVQHTINEIRSRSTILNELQKSEKIKIVGAMYHLSGGAVEFIS